MTGGIINLYTFSDSSEEPNCTSSWNSSLVVNNPEAVAYTGEYSGHQRLNSVAQNASDSAINPFIDCWEEEKKSVVTTFTCNRLISTPPSYSTARVIYQRTPDNALRRKRKIKQVPNEILSLTSIQQHNKNPSREPSKSEVVKEELKCKNEIGNKNCCCEKLTCVLL